MCVIRRLHCAAWMLLAILAVSAVLAPLRSRAEDDFAVGRRIFLEKADCA